MRHPKIVHITTQQDEIRNRFIYFSEAAEGALDTHVVAYGDGEKAAVFTEADNKYLRKVRNLGSKVLRRTAPESSDRYQKEIAEAVQRAIEGQGVEDSVCPEYLGKLTFAANQRYAQDAHDRLLRRK